MKCKSPKATSQIVLSQVSTLLILLSAASNKHSRRKKVKDLVLLMALKQEDLQHLDLKEENLGVKQLLVEHLEVVMGMLKVKAVKSLNLEVQLVVKAKVKKVKQRLRKR
jgi:hypothetical protein